MPIAHRVAERRGKIASDFPILFASQRRHHFAHHRNTPLGVGERSILLEKRRAGQENMRVLRGLVQENIVDDHDLHRL